MVHEDEMTAGASGYGTWASWGSGPRHRVSSGLLEHRSDYKTFLSDWQRSTAEQSLAGA